MKTHNLKHLVLLLFCFCFNHSLKAQAPGTLADFTDKVLTLTITNGTANSVSAWRIFTNGSLLRSGSLAGNPTNAAYTNLSSNSGLLVLSSVGGTNNLTMFSQTADSGLFTNQFQITGVPQLQSNYGGYTLTAGTNIAPIITSTTGSMMVQSNSSPTLNVSATGFDLRFQWRLNGNDLSGGAGQTNFYNLAGIQSSNAGDYTCVISNSAGVVTSAVINVSIAQPIVFSQHPQTQEILEGSFLTLSYAATGSISSSQWMFNGTVAFPPATNNLYTVPIVSSTHAGKYHVAIGGFGVATNSQTAVVTVRKPGTNAAWLSRPFVKVADDKMAVPGFTNHFFTNWISATNKPQLTFRDGKIHFVAGTTAKGRSLFRWTNGALETLIFTNTARPAGGSFGDLTYPTDEGNGAVNFTDNSNDPSYAGMYAYSSSGISNIINYNTAIPGRTNNFFGVPGSYGRRGHRVAISASIFSALASFVNVGHGIFFHDSAQVTRICDNTTPLPGALSGYGARPTGNSLNFDGASMVFSTTGVSPGNSGGFYKATADGTIIKLADSNDLRPGSTTQTFTNCSDIDVDGEVVFAVANNQVYKFEADGASASVGSGTYVSAAGARMAYYGNSSSLSRWNNGVVQSVLPGSALVDNKLVSQILAADGQGDDVTVLLKFSDNSTGIYIASGAASTQPLIMSEPLDFAALENNNASFHVSAAGQAPLFYHWRKDGSSITGAVNPSLFLTNVQTSAVAGYSVVVSNNHGSVTSRVAQLTRTAPPRPILLSGPLQAGTAYFSSNVTISVTAAGAAPLSFIWMKDSMPIAGVNNPNLTLTNLGASDRASYSVVVSNANGTVSSGSIQLTVSPIFSQQPVSISERVGGTASFTALGAGIPPLTYQWVRHSPTFATLTDETNSTLTFTNLSTANSGTYSARVTSASNGLTASSLATLTVLTNLVLTTNVSPAGAGAITLNPPGGIYNSNTTVTVTASANAGFQFSHWSGAATAQTNRVTVTMTASQTITANFTNATTFTITKNVNPSSVGVVTANPPGANYVSNAVVTLTATANFGFKFVRWSGASTATTTQITLTMNANKSATALFTNVPVYQLTRTSNPARGGTVTASPLPGTNDYYAAGTVVSLTANANTGYRFSQWTRAVRTNLNPLTLTIATNTTITANFTNIPNYLLSATVNPPGAGTVLASPSSSSNRYYAGTVVTLTAQANGTNIFAAWSGAVSGLSNSASVTMNTNQTVTALFNNPGHLLFQHTNGQTAVWFLQGTQRLAAANLSSVSSVWRLGAAADFDHNGSKDLIFHHLTDGRVVLWQMSGNQRTNSIVLRGGIPAPVTWRLVGAADFNHDDQPDLLWQDNTRVLRTWLMNGTGFGSEGVLRQGIAPGIGWQAVAAADFNTNASPDVLFQHTDRRLAVWFMDGANFTDSALVRPGSVAPAGWKAVGVGDMNSNGQNDLLFQHLDRRLAVWFFNGITFTHSASLNGGVPLGAGWKLSVMK